jgi:hypothetical protein
MHGDDRDTRTDQTLQARAAGQARALFTGDLSASSTIKGLLAAVIVGTLGLLVGVRAMRRSA